MTPVATNDHYINERVRAILLTDEEKVLFIKRVKLRKEPYWIAPGGGVENNDKNLHNALHRELCEELGATIEIVRRAFVLEHTIGNKNLREHFFICRLLHYDLQQRNGPEFDDPTRGEYIPYIVPLEPEAFRHLNIKTPELAKWLTEHLQTLREISRTG